MIMILINIKSSNYFKHIFIFKTIFKVFIVVVNKMLFLIGVYIGILLPLWNAFKIDQYVLALVWVLLSFIER